MVFVLTNLVLPGRLLRNQSNKAIRSSTEGNERTATCMCHYGVRFEFLVLSFKQRFAAWAVTYNVDGADKMGISLQRRCIVPLILDSCAARDADFKYHLNYPSGIVIVDHELREKVN